MPTSLALALLALAGAQDEPAEPREAPGIPVLLVTGASNHDWEWTSESIERILEATGRFDVTTTHHPASVLADEVGLRDYAAFVLDYNGERWGPLAERNFVAAVRGGTGVVVVHASNNAFDGWVEYEELVGLLWRAGTGHGRFHAFDVRVVDRDHPVTRTLPDLRAHPDELYHRLVSVHGAPHRVLAVARSSVESGGTGELEPMIVVKRYGEGRVFHTPLGHVWPGAEDTRRSLADPQLANLIARGTEWAATGSVVDGTPAPNRLTSLERAAGWRLLFDGETTAGWRGYGRAGFPERGWEVLNGCLRHVDGGGGGDLVTTETFGELELAFEWKVAAGANSGVKIGLEEGAGAPRGLEYQVLDDGLHQDGADGLTSAGALYGLYAPEPFPGGAPKALAPAGAFNAARIVLRDGVLEHWLNGERVVRAEVGGEAWRARLAASKLAGDERFAEPPRGRIGLQDHGGEVWFRDLRIRDLEALPGKPVALFDGETLAGWRALGDARFAADDGTILGEVGGGAQSFLVTERSFGDLLLELDVKSELPGNSGIQVRSRVADDGHVTGYQVEIDPSERAWSGGLYDEARRGWLQSPEGDEAARAAFRPGEWNRYRIECVGPSLRTWVNGVPVADGLDPLDVEGFVGLQVHAGDDTRVRWRDLVLRDLGTRAWEPFAAAPELRDWTRVYGDARAAEDAILLSPTDETPVIALSNGSLDDFCARLLFHEGERPGLGIGFRVVPNASLDELAATGGVSATPRGWQVVPSHPAFAHVYRAGAWNNLHVSAYGPRVAIHLNGRLIATADGTRSPDAALAGRLLLRVAAGSDAATVRQIEVLSEPR